MENEERKLDVIRNAIQKAFPDAKIDYSERKYVHYNFLIDREGRPPCWLYFVWEYLLDHNEQEVLERLRRFNVFETLLNAPEQKWLAVGDFGVQEVDDSYGRGY